MGGLYGRGQQEVGVANGWNLWVWLVSVVVRRHIIIKNEKHLKMNKEIGMMLPKKS